MYRIDYQNGQSETAETYRAAVKRVKTQYPDAAIGHDGDLTEGGDRTLCWLDAKAADGDDGAHASIRRVSARA